MNNDEEMKILEKIKEILKGDKIDRLPSLRIVDKSRLMKTVKIVDNEIGKIQARNITNKQIDICWSICSIRHGGYDESKNRKERAMVEGKIGRASETDAKRPWFHK